MKLVIVESPAKVATIEKFLGEEYRVEASYGHVRDLPKGRKSAPKSIRDKPWADLCVNTEGGFEPEYVVPPDSAGRLRKIGKLLESAEELLLATDVDREGESIGWHLVDELKPSIPVKRIGFQEITESAVRRAIENPGEINMLLVEAQEARRVLDRLFGYRLSKVLWQRVRYGLSAGRVQSAALRMVVEREEERLRFKAAEYWKVEAKLEGAGRKFSAKLVKIDDARVASGKDFDRDTGTLRAGSSKVVLDEKFAAQVAARTLDVCPWRVISVKSKSVQKPPPRPFKTSTLQRDASSRLKMSPTTTMFVAQRLYEGVALANGQREGLITYMRTDSEYLSREALDDAGKFIRAEYGDRHHKRRQYRTKSQSAQEAHEAIRPTKVTRTPDQIARFLNPEQLKLYRLIWSRTVASQMANSESEETTVELAAVADDAEHVFRATGSVMRFEGFRKVYGTPHEEKLLPPLKEGDLILDGRKPLSKEQPDAAAVVRSINFEKCHTNPPRRYTEASLVKRLEDEGIGRPSTYAETVSKIRNRKYVRKKEKGGGLAPTFVGMVVMNLLRSNFDRYVDLGFTAKMENALDEIAVGNLERQSFLDAFYNGKGERAGLDKTIEQTLPNVAYPSVPWGEDPETGEVFRVRIGRNSVYAERGDGESRKTVTIPEAIPLDELTPDHLAQLFAAKAESERLLGEDPESGQPVRLRLGPHGHYVQLDVQTDNGGRSKKPRPRRIGIPKEMPASEVTLGYALRLLSLPRELGIDPRSGEPVFAGLGYKPYVKLAREYRNLESVEQIFAVTLKEALDLLAQPKPSNRRVIKVLGAHPESGAEISVLKGRYGPYVTDGKLNATVPKGREPEEITMEEAVELLAKKAAAPKKTRRGRTTRRRTPARRKTG